MNNLLFFTGQSARGEVHPDTKNDEYSFVKKSIRDVNPVDFNLVTAADICKETFNKTISECPYKVVHFTVECACGQELVVGDLLPQDIVNCFRILSQKTHIRCIIFNGDNTVNIAKSMTEFSEFTVGTNRIINTKEAHDFAKGFFQSLAENEIIFDQTVVEAFRRGVLHSELSLSGSGKEHPYVLFTTKFEEVSEINKQSTSVKEIKNQAECESALGLLKEINKSAKRLDEINQELQTNSVNQKMINWLDFNLDPIIDQVAEEVMKEYLKDSTKKDHRRFIFSLKKSFYLIKQILEIDAMDHIDEVTTLYEFDKGIYQAAFILLDKKIPNENNAFDAPSRYALRSVLQHLQTH